MENTIRRRPTDQRHAAARTIPKSRNHDVSNLVTGPTRHVSHSIRVSASRRLPQHNSTANGYLVPVLFASCISSALVFTLHVGSFSYLDVLFGVQQVLKKSIFIPYDTTLLVSGRVRVTFLLSTLRSKKAIQVGSLLVRTTFFHGVALTALGLENLGSLFLTHTCN